MDRIYIAIDLKSFYASVECVERKLDPLTARLVVADESRTDKTICLAVTPALKAYGISGRARLFEVYQRIAEIKAMTGKTIDFIIAPPQMRKYIQVSSDIYSIYLKYISAEDIHVYSVDEVFIDVTGYLHLYKKNAHEIAVMLIQDVLKKTGITATAGIGTNLYLAQIAMDIYAKHKQADKDGVRIGYLDEYKYKRFMWQHTPITDFWQVGRGTANRLERQCIYNMGELARASLNNEIMLYRTFGINAQILIDHAWGIEPTLMEDIKNYKPTTNSLSTGQVLQCPYSAENARIIVFEMSDGLALDLVRKRLVTGSLTMDIGYDRENVDKGIYNGIIHLDHYGRTVPNHAHGTIRLERETNSSRDIITGALNLYDRIIDRALTIRRITIYANKVIDEKSVIQQLDLFTDFGQAAKQKNLQLAELSIKSKYGKNAILKGTNFLEGATARERNGQVGGHKA
ncbi:MAG: DNA methylase [Firmicutes bacterium]|nr:DNA methylase [Bacillota bacterium]